MINLGIPECYAYIRDAIFAILAEYEIGYIKWDHNRDLIDAGTQPTGRPGVHEQTLAFYRLVDEIKAAHPGLEIESCSSGGARVDLGVLERTDRVWVSDCIDPLERQQMHRWTTQLIPPELMGAHIASGRSHTTGREHDLNFRAATAIFGHLGIEWDLEQGDRPAELAELATGSPSTSRHRDLLLGGDLVRIDFPDETLTATGVVAPDRSPGDLLLRLRGPLRGGSARPGADARTRPGPALPGRTRPAAARAERPTATAVVECHSRLGPRRVRGPRRPQTANLRGDRENAWRRAAGLGARLGRAWRRHRSTPTTR